MKNGIFFLTFDGYYNFTSGIGTQTKTFLRGIEFHYEKYAEKYGDFEINLIVPTFDNTVYGFDQEHIDYANTIINKFGGSIYTCASVLDKDGADFWTVTNWEKMSTSAAEIILKESKKYKKCIVITIDPPFLHTPRYIYEQSKTEVSIQCVIMLYTSSYIHDQKLSYERLGWEYSGLASVREYKKIKIGNVCEYMHDHLLKFYAAEPSSFVPYPSSLTLEDIDFTKLDQPKILKILNKYQIPLDKDIIFSFGRSAWVKGFDILLKSLSHIKNRLYLVLVVTQFEDSRISEYQKLIQEGGIECTLITEFTRELPKTLCQYERCKIVVCPSRNEPFSNIPLEVGLWAKDKGPVILASNIGGFMEQINDGENGFKFNINDQEDLTKKIELILGISEDRLRSIRLDAYNKVKKERDFFKNFDSLLGSMWE